VETQKLMWNFYQGMMHQWLHRPVSSSFCWILYFFKLSSYFNCLHVRIWLIF
jgi:hypothetical protein